MPRVKRKMEERRGHTFNNYKIRNMRCRNVWQHELFDKIYKNIQ